MTIGLDYLISSNNSYCISL